MNIPSESEYTNSEKKLFEETLLEIANLDIEGYEERLGYVAHLINYEVNESYEAVIEEVISLIDEILSDPRHTRSQFYTSRLRKTRKILRTIDLHKVCWGCEGILKERVHICPLCHQYRFITQARVITATSTRSGLRQEPQTFDGLAS